MESRYGLKEFTRASLRAELAILLIVLLSTIASAQNFIDPPSPLTPGQDVWLRSVNANFRQGMSDSESGVSQYRAVLDRLFTQDALPILDVVRDGVRTTIPSVPPGSYSIYLDRITPPFLRGYAFQPVIVSAQGITCNFTDWYTGAVASPIVELQRVRFACFSGGVAINLRQGYGRDEDITDRFFFLFAPSGAQKSGAFQINTFDGGFVVPPGAAGSTSVTITKRGWFSITVPFSTPVAMTAPRLTKRISVLLVLKTSNDPDSEDGILTLPGFYYFIEIEGTGFGTGGAYTATFRNVATGVTHEQDAFVAVPSNGVAGGFARVQILIYSAFLPPGTYEISVRPGFGGGPASPPETFTFNAPTP